jgi:hypothetical protein
MNTKILLLRLPVFKLSFPEETGLKAQVLPGSEKASHHGNILLK